MKNNLPLEVKVNLWDFIDVEKLNEYMDEWSGEVISGLTYTFNDVVKPNGDTVITVDGDDEQGGEKEALPFHTKIITFYP